MYPAKNGDAFMVTMSGSDRTAILIDGGFSETFQNHIRPDLESLAQSGHLLDLVIATHIDADHVGGLLEFLKLNGNASTPSTIGVRNVWHNSVRGISAPVDVVSPHDLPILEAVAQRGYPPLQSSSSIQQISAAQGSSLAALLLAGEYGWNEGAGRTTISTEALTDIRNIGAASVQLLSPSSARLAALESWWKSELRKKGFASQLGSGQYFDDAFEFMSARSDLQQKMAPAIKEISGAARSLLLSEVYVPDKSVTNASSISVLIKVGGKSLLFLGDCLAEDLVEQVARRAVRGERVWFDLIKLSHHGSVHNTSPELLALIDSDTYLISSNGDKHGHPDFPVLKAIVDRPAQFTRTLHFNYSTPASRALKQYASESGAGFTVQEHSTDWITFS